MTEKLTRRGLRIHQDYEADVLQVVRVAEAMDRNPPTIPATMSIGELAARIARNDPEVCRHQALLVVDEGRHLEGIITRGDVLRALDREPSGVSTVLASSSTNPVVAHQDETLSEAVDKMLRHDVGRLPVVDRANPKLVVGYLGRPNIMAARMSRMEEEHVRETGWMGGRAVDVVRPPVRTSASEST